MQYKIIVFVVKNAVCVNTTQVLITAPEIRAQVLFQSIQWMSCFNNTEEFTLIIFSYFNHTFLNIFHLTSFGICCC